MSTIWNKIHRIKDNGWTWQTFLQTIDQHFPGGIDEKTLYQHHRRPDIKTTRHVAEIINFIHELRFPSPFPTEIDALFSLYNNLHVNTLSNSYEQDIQLLEKFLSAQLALEKPSLRRSRISWLLGNIYFDRIPKLRDNGKKSELHTSRELAVQFYQQALNDIQAVNLVEQSVMAFISYKLQQNILACYLNSVFEDKRSTDPLTLKYLKDSNFIQASIKLLEEEPFNWQVARNGLRFSSMLQDSNNCELFFKALVKAYKGFSDPNFKPVNYSSIAEGENFQWALDNVLQVNKKK